MKETLKLMSFPLFLFCQMLFPSSRALESKWVPIPLVLMRREHTLGKAHHQCSPQQFATHSEIKAAHCRKVLEYHPDRFHQQRHTSLSDAENEEDNLSTMDLYMGISARRREEEGTRCLIEENKRIELRWRIIVGMPKLRLHCDVTRICT